MVVAARALDPEDEGHTSRAGPCDRRPERRLVPAAQQKEVGPRRPERAPCPTVEDDPAAAEGEVDGGQYEPGEAELVRMQPVRPQRVAFAKEEHRQVDAVRECVEERDPVRRRNLGQHRESGHARRRAVAKRNHP